MGMERGILMFEENSRSIKLFHQLVGTYCETCLKKERVVGGYRCSVLTGFYFTDKRALNECWAFEGNLKRWVDQLQQLKNYLLKIEVDTGKVEFDIKKAGERKVFSREARLMFFEESHKSNCKKGMGEKQDRTHKLFPKDRMKDNRYMLPWGE